VLAGEATSRQGEEPHDVQHVYVLNFNNIGMMHLLKVKDWVKDIMGHTKSTYPEQLHRMYMINTGPLFRLMWLFMKRFLHPLTENKIRIVGSDWKEMMQKDGIELDQIPASWGGEGTMEVIMGRDAEGYDEKSMEDEEEKEDADGEDQEKRDADGEEQEKEDADGEGQDAAGREKKECQF